MILSACDDVRSLQKKMSAIDATPTIEMQGASTHDSSAPSTATKDCTINVPAAAAAAAAVEAAGGAPGSKPRETHDGRSVVAASAEPNPKSDEPNAWYQRAVLWVVFTIKSGLVSEPLAFPM